MFFAGGALPGQGDARLLLAGPALACVAGTAVARAWWLTRHLDGSRVWTDRSPFADLRSLTRFRLPTLGPAAVAVVAALSAFLRDRGESGSTLHGSILVGAIEAGFVLAAYVLLCAPLGVRRLRTGLGYD